MGMFNLLGGKTKTDSIEKYLQKGAVVVDVRTVAEFMEGHVSGSKNIPLNEIDSNIEEIKQLDKPIIAVCRSGARSGTATNILKDQGVNIINGGPWQTVADLMK